MPLVRISLLKGRSAELRRKIGDAAGDLVYDSEYLGIARTDQIVIALFRRIADNLAALGGRREDAWINLVEVAKENWSFGLGEASYAAPQKIPA